MEPETTTPTVEEPTKEQAQAEFYNHLATLQNSPSKEQVGGWKVKHGEIFCSAFSDSEIFIWRPLSRKEFVEMQNDLMKQAQASGTPPSELELEERIVNQCMLWVTDSGKKALTFKGGSVSAVHEQILLNSNLLNSNVAATLVVKL